MRKAGNEDVVIRITDCSEAGEGEEGRRSQEVRHGGSWGDGALVVGDCVEDLELAVEVLIQGQDGCHVATAVAVVGSGPHGDQVLLIKHVLVALLDQLMRPADQLQPVDMDELSSHAGPKQPPCSSRRYLPGFDVLWI